MKFYLALFIFLIPLNSGVVHLQSENESTQIHFSYVVSTPDHFSTVQLKFQRPSHSCLFVYKATNLLHLHYLSILKDWFIVSADSLPAFCISLNSKSGTFCCKSRLLVIILLLISGNVQPNPGPDSIKLCDTAEDFKSRSGLGIIHLNVRSLKLKLDMVNLWVRSTDADIVVLSETWLTKPVLDADIGIEGYNVYRSDRPKRRGGVAIYVKCKFHSNLVLSKSVCKQIEFLALNLEVSKEHHIRLVGCYRTLSASNDSSCTLSNLLSQVICNDTIVVGDLNWDWLRPISDAFKEQCDILNLTQLINTPTRPNPKCPEKSSLIDLILTNAPFKYSEIGVFANDVSDHCVMAAVRDTKV